MLPIAKAITLLRLLDLDKSSCSLLSSGPASTSPKLALQEAISADAALNAVEEKEIL
jgi:hypothetical protein